MGEKESRAIALLNKVYDQLETVDVTKLSMQEMGDFLEVVQKGRFLETFGAFSGYTSGFNSCNCGVEGGLGSTLGDVADCNYSSAVSE